MTPSLWAIGTYNKFNVGLTHEYRPMYNLKNFFYIDCLDSMDSNFRMCCSQFSESNAPVHDVKDLQRVVNQRH